MAPGGKWAVACDFDGTVTTRDVAEEILRKYTGDAWLSVEKEYRDGKIGSREALARQFALVRAGKEEIVSFALKSAVVRRGFKAFVDKCQTAGIPFVILSEGLDFYIGPVLKKAGVDAKFEANSAAFAGNRISIIFRDPARKSPLSGVRKEARVMAFQKSGRKVLYIGDGYSDMDAAKRADVLLARGALLKKLGGMPFKDFHQAKNVLEGLG
ncbi:MAG: MtnX-like HAD-IB family phosphatase [Euryarchaeota archaeon]|nr:MtnX-like HAD-IB family phosphatase [Euryarchaeota archaeon]